MHDWLQVVMMNMTSIEEGSSSNEMKNLEGWMHNKFVDVAPTSCVTLSRFEME